MKQLFKRAVVCLAFTAAVNSMAQEEWQAWRQTFSGWGIGAASDTFAGESSAYGYVLEYELALPHRFAAFANYREMEYESDGLDYSMRTYLETDGELSGTSFGGRYYAVTWPGVQVYFEGGYGLWKLEEDDYRNGLFDDHSDYDADVVLLGAGVRVPIYDLPLDLMANILLGYLWWDETWGTDDDLYLAAGLGFGIHF